MFDFIQPKIVRAKTLVGSAFQNDPVISNGVAYSALDAVGGKLVFPGVSSARGGGGLIWGFTVIDKGQIKAALKLFLFNDDITVAADNAAFTISDADAEKAIGVLATGTYEDIAAVNSIYTVAFSNPIAYRTVANRSLYGQLRCTATPTYTNVAQLVVKLHVTVQD